MTETKNISGSGVYCQVSQPLRDFSKLEVILWVPLRKGQPGFDVIHGKGVVVRSEKVLCKNGTPQKFFIAVYFTKLNPKDRVKLCRYVAHHLTHGTD